MAANRKNLGDEDVEELCNSLKRNKFLEKLELEYNKITSQSMKKINELLTTNESIKHMSLEGNNLCSENDDSGIQTLCEALKVNQSMLFLNLSLTNLTPNCGNYIIDMLTKNKTLIMIHLQGNKLSHDSMKKIQELLIENRKSFENERILETEERNNMFGELMNLEKIEKAIKKKKSEVNMIVDKINQKQLWREEMFVEEIEKQDEAEMRLMKKLEKEASVRLLRKKKRPNQKSATK